MKLDVDCQTQEDAEWGLVRTTSRDNPTIENYIYDLGKYTIIYVCYSHTCTNLKMIIAFIYTLYQRDLEKEWMLTLSIRKH